MPCYCPLTAWYSKSVGRTGKRGITFTRDAAFSPVPLKLPCGQCVGCRLERSRQWAIRCMHERQMHKSNVFLTLTYDDKHLPPGGTLVKRDLQLFFKRLRKKYGEGVRFYACGEYGEITGRPHYHAIVFNLDIKDKKFFKRQKNGKDLYNSASIGKLWPAGHVVIGDVEWDSCAYVARYIMKKVTGDKAANYYDWFDLQTGEIFTRQPEFTNMSRRPGIGLRWFEKYGAHSYKWDSVIMNNREVRPPRYYDTKFEALDPAALRKLKLKRRKVARRNRADNTPERLRVRERVTILNLAEKGRGL